MTLDCALNFAYTLFNLGLAAYSQSFWFLTMAAYYMAVFAMQLSAVLHRNSTEPRSRKKSLEHTAIFMFALAIVFVGIVCLSIAEKRNTSYGTIIAITMATYTFYYAIFAIVNLFRSRKDDAQKTRIRNAAMANALGSLFELEKTMLATFGNAMGYETLVMEAASGAGMILVIVLLGIMLLLKARKESSAPY